MQPILGETIVLDLPPLVHPTTGVPSDADETPTARVYEDASDAAILTPTVVKRSGTTGEYRVSIACTTAGGFEVGKSYNVKATAVVAGLTGSTTLARFVLRADTSVSVQLSAALPIRNQDAVTAPTVGDALLGAWCAAFGKEFVQGRSHVKRRPDSSTPVRTFALNSATNPTSRS